ncbi:MAG: MFS transporter, partial [Caldilineae bacterium]
MGLAFADRRYWTVWGATLIFFGAFYTLLVPLPRYLDVIGLPDWQIGFILGAFGIASLFGRPLAGAFTDRLGSRPVILFGTAALTVGAAGVSLTTWPPALFVLRILQAAGYVTFTTASTALIAHLAPAARRGAAIGFFGVAANVAMTLTPATISTGLTQSWFSLEGAFWLCGGMALLA